MKRTKQVILIIISFCLIIPALGYSKQKTLKLSPIGDAPQELNKAQGPGSDRIVCQHFGRIDRVGKKELVINDSLRYISRASKFYSSSNSLVSTLNLKVGQQVEFDYNRKNHITRLRLVK